MPPRANPKDWDRLFGASAPRRGGPLRALANILLFGLVIGLLGGAVFFSLRFGLDQARASAQATAQAVATSNAQVIATQTARALVTPTPEAAAVLATPSPTAEALLGRGSVTGGGNLRREPVLAPETVIGQICPGDQVDFLEQRTLEDGAVWYRIRLSGLGESCAATRVSLGSSGWASATLLSEPAP